MTRLAERLTVWGPSVLGAALGGLVDFFDHFWGPGLVSGAVIGFLIGQRWLAAQRRDVEPSRQATDGPDGPED